MTKTLGQTQHFFDMWFRTLVGFAFYPPIFLFIFYVMTLIMAQMATNGTLFNSLQNVATTKDSVYMISLISSVVIRLGFVITILFIGLKAADWIVEQIGGLAATIMNKASGAVLGGGFRMAAGTLGWAGRNTVGRGMQRANESNWLRDKAKDNVFARTLWRGTGALGKKTYDVRNAPGGSILKKGVSAVAGDMNIGKASEKSFAELDKKRADRKEAEGKALKPSKANIEIAQQNEIKKLSDQDKQGLANAAKAYDIAKKKVDEVGTSESRRELSAAKIEFDRRMKPVKDAVEKQTGDSNADAYAQNITTPRLWNLGLPSKASYEAASKLRDTKNKGGGVLATLKKVAPHITPNTGNVATAIIPHMMTTQQLQQAQAGANRQTIQTQQTAQQMTAAQLAAAQAGVTNITPQNPAPSPGALPPPPAAQPMTRQALDKAHEKHGSLDAATEALTAKLEEQTAKQERQGEKLISAVEKLGQKIASTEAAKTTPAKPAESMWKVPPSAKNTTVTLDEKSMRALKGISKGLENILHKPANDNTPPAPKPQIEKPQNEDTGDKKEGA